MTSALSSEPLLEDGRAFGAAVGLECWTADVPDGSGGVWQNPAPCSAHDMSSVRACEVRVGGTRGSWGRRLVAVRGIRSTSTPERPRTHA
jgi:hypothetical protein